MVLGGGKTNQMTIHSDNPNRTARESDWAPWTWREETRRVVGAAGMRKKWNGVDFRPWSIFPAPSLLGKKRFGRPPQQGLPGFHFLDSFFRDEDVAANKPKNAFHFNSDCHLWKIQKEGVTMVKTAWLCKFYIPRVGWGVDSRSSRNPPQGLGPCNKPGDP